MPFIINILSLECCGLCASRGERITHFTVTTLRGYIHSINIVTFIMQINCLTPVRSNTDATYAFWHIIVAALSKDAPASSDEVLVFTVAVGKVISTLPIGNKVVSGSCEISSIVGYCYIPSCHHIIFIVTTIANVMIVTGRIAEDFIIVR